MFVKTSKEVAASAAPVHLARELLKQWLWGGAPAVPEVKRRKPRKGVFPDPVELQLLRNRGVPTVAHARSRDISESGMGIMTRNEIKPRELVDLTFRLDGVCYTVRARVAHCTQTLGGYKVGLEFLFD